MIGTVVLLSDYGNPALFLYYMSLTHISFSTSRPIGIHNRKKDLVLLSSDIHTMLSFCRESDIISPTKRSLAHSFYLLDLETLSVLRSQDIFLTKLSLVSASCVVVGYPKTDFGVLLSVPHSLRPLLFSYRGLLLLSRLRLCRTQ